MVSTSPTHSITRAVAVLLSAAVPSCRHNEFFAQVGTTQCKFPHCWWNQVIRTARDELAPASELLPPSRLTHLYRLNCRTFPDGSGRSGGVLLLPSIRCRRGPCADRCTTWRQGRSRSVGRSRNRRISAPSSFLFPSSSSLINVLKS